LRETLVSALSADDIDAFVQIFEASDWDQVDVVVGDVNLHLSKTDRARTRLVLRSGAAATEVPAPAARAGGTSIENAAPAASAATLFDIAAPHVGTFFRAATPGGRPLVEIGQEVGNDTEVCRLVVMKRSLGVRAGLAGVVREIGAMDGALIEGGQVLFRVEPN
jgi:acetyl-CoA carboxylase biotin carboxyl carrier protein